MGGQDDRVNVQTDPSVHDNTRVQSCSGTAAPVSTRLSRNLRLPVGIVRIEVKGGMGEEFPGNMGLKHEIPTARNVSLLLRQYVALYRQ